MSLPTAAPVGRRWRPGLTEGLLAVAATAISVWVLASAGDAAGFNRPNVLAYALTGLGGAVVLWGRRRPLNSRSSLQTHRARKTDNQCWWWMTNRLCGCW